MEGEREKEKERERERKREREKDSGNRTVTTAKCHDASCQNQSISMCHRKQRVARASSIEKESAIATARL